MWVCEGGCLCSGVSWEGGRTPVTWEGVVKEKQGGVICVHVHVHVAKEHSRHSCTCTCTCTYVCAHSIIVLN